MIGTGYINFDSSDGSSKVSSIESRTDSYVDAVVPSGVGSIYITIYISGSVSNQIYFAYNIPVLSSVLPTYGPNNNGSSLLTVVGFNFGLFPIVLINSVAINSYHFNNQTLLMFYPPSGTLT